MENAAEKPTGTGEASEIPKVENAQFSTTRHKPAVRSGFYDQLGHKLPVVYTEPPIEVDDENRYWIDHCCRPPCFHNRTKDAKYSHANPVLRAFLYSQNPRASMFLSKVSMLYLHDVMSMQESTAGVEEYGILAAE